RFRSTALQLTVAGDSTSAHGRGRRPRRTAEVQYDGGFASGLVASPRKDSAMTMNVGAVFVALLAFAPHLGAQRSTTPAATRRGMEVVLLRFCHVEHDKDNSGTFSFVHIWRQTSAGWKISRVVSYGH